MRILLKLSGEALSWGKWFGFDKKMLDHVSELVEEMINDWHQIWIVVWAWNFIRWAEVWDIDRCIADNMWMLAININALALYDYFTKRWIKVRNLNSFAIDWVADRFNKPKALKFFEKSGVLIIWWWTWNPYFTTDTAWVLRALEIEADLLIKATKVDWLYDKDPKKFDDAKLISHITYNEVLRERYKLMDLTAITLAKTNNLKIAIANLYKKEKILDILKWKNWWTIISGELTSS